MTSRNKKITSNEDRKRIIDAYKIGDDYLKTAVMLKIKRTTALMIIKRYLKTGDFMPDKVGGYKKSILNNEQILYIQEILDENCTVSLKIIQQKIFTRFSLLPSISTISRYISSFYYTLKRLQVVSDRRNDEQSIQARFDYARQFIDMEANNDLSRIIFVDEVGFCVSMRPSRGRAMVGATPTLIVRSIKTRNLSVCSAMNHAKLLYHRVQDSAYNSVSFSSFLEALIDELANQNINNPILIVDNVPFHKNVHVKETIIRKQASIIFLPPHSPFLNPIENLFSKWKNSVKMSLPRNEQHLIELITSKSDLINSEDCIGYYRKMKQYISRALNREIIID